MELVREHILFAIVGPVPHDACMGAWAVTQGVPKLCPFVIARQARGQLVAHQPPTGIGKPSADLPGAVLHLRQSAGAVVFVTDQNVRSFSFCADAQNHLLQSIRAVRILQLQHAPRTIGQVGEAPHVVVPKRVVATVAILHPQQTEDLWTTRVYLREPLVSSFGCDNDILPAGRALHPNTLGHAEHALARYGRIKGDVPPIGVKKDQLLLPPRSAAKMQLHGVRSTPALAQRASRTYVKAVVHTLPNHRQRSWQHKVQIRLTGQQLGASGDMNRIAQDCRDRHSGRTSRLARFDQAFSALDQRLGILGQLPQALDVLQKVTRLSNKQCGAQPGIDLTLKVPDGFRLAANEDVRGSLVNGGTTDHLVAFSGCECFVDDGLLRPHSRALRNQVDRGDGVFAADHFIQRRSVGCPCCWYAVHKDIGRPRGDFPRHFPCFGYQPIRYFFANGTSRICNGRRRQSTRQHHRPGKDRRSQSSGGDRAHCCHSGCDTGCNRACTKSPQCSRTSGDTDNLGQQARIRIAVGDRVAQAGSGWELTHGKGAT